MEKAASSGMPLLPGRVAPISAAPGAMEKLGSAAPGESPATVASRFGASGAEARGSMMVASLAGFGGGSWGFGGVGVFPTAGLAGSLSGATTSGWLASSETVKAKVLPHLEHLGV